MANNSMAQFFPHHLHPLKIDEATLRGVLGDLQAAVKRGIDLVQAHLKALNATEIEEGFGTIFSGSLGIFLMFLRLEAQARAPPESDDANKGTAGHCKPLPDVRTLLKERSGINALRLDLQPGRPSPLCSPSLGATIIRILATISQSDLSIPGLNLQGDIAALHDVVRIAISQELTVIRNGHSMGGDEVLYGRAGLLWSLTNIDRYNDLNALPALGSVLALKPKLSGAIVDAGRNGGLDYARKVGETNALPLMWPWLDEYYGLGAMHGITGILTVLLGCEISERDYSDIGDTITRLCRICISNNGHLPMSIPQWPRSRPSPLVQICHGAPGLLLLLAAAQGIPGLEKYQSPDWDEAIRLGSQRIWEEGLLSKGAGLCHGIAGNAWPWLLLHEKYIVEEIAKSAPSTTPKEDASQIKELSADYFLSRALTFLLAARGTPPFAEDSRYRVPDNPFSLFEGLAGTICAWSEACAIITARLKLMEVQAKDQLLVQELRNGIYTSYKSDALGFPGLGGII